MASASDADANRASKEPGDGQLELNRLDVLKGLRLSTWDGALATIWLTLTTGAFLTGFALWLGADAVGIGLLTAIPTLAGLVQIVSSYTSERSRSRKRITAIYSLAGRLLWLPILAVPFLLPRAIALPVFFALFAASYALVNVPAPAWMSWMSDLVPPDHRGRYFGRRNMIAGLVGMLVGLPAAWFLDVTVKRNHHPALGFGVLFGIGVVGGILSVLCVLRQPEPPRRSAPAVTPGGGLKHLTEYYASPFTDPNFRRLMAFNTVFGLGQNVAAPFFTVYSLQALGLNYIWLQILAAVTGFASLASMPLWGYLTDKFGNKPLLAIAVCGVVTIPFTWVLTGHASSLVLWALLFEISVASGLFWAGVGLAQFNLLIGFSPPDKTSIYVATMAAVTGLTGGLAPLAGSAVMRSVHGLQVPIIGLHLTNYHLLFCISGVLRGAGLLFLRPIVDSRARSTRDVIRQLRRVGPRDWRNLRRLQRTTDADVRLRATEALGESRTRLASTELQSALRDPSPAVRAEAARALGEIGDRGAVGALLEALQDPASGTTAEIARALGRLGDRRACPPLCRLLTAPPHPVSRRDLMAVVQTLGELGGTDAVAALMEALQRTQDDELAETLIEAVGRTGSGRAVPALLEWMGRQDLALGVRLAVIRALGELGDPSARESIRAELARTDGDVAVVPMVADALAQLRDETAVVPLLSHLERLASPTARKQVAHAIGRLMGVGELAYSLLANDEMARDLALSRLTHELQRSVRGSATPNRLKLAGDALTEGDSSGALRELQEVIRSLPGRLSARTAADRGLDLALEWIGAYDRADPWDEIVLLGFCALRGRILE